MSRSRQLAAIMFTDIQGYTALMQQNEEKAVQVRDKHRRIFNAVTEKYKGKILQYYGDGTLSIFDSAFEAVQCGIEMQLGFRENPVIPVRIGVHTGDIIFSEEEIIGDSVNVASRIESLAVPGSVFISDKVYDEIKNQKSIKTFRLKAFKLKNIARPIEVYAISNAGLIVPKLEEVKGKTSEEPAPGAKKQQEPSSDVPAAPPPPLILATKLYIPPLRPKVVLRPRLIDRLNNGLHAKLTLVSAAAGFGKTTLISEWIANSKRPAAWLSLDERDNDPARFLIYLISALQTIRAEIGANALALLQFPQPPPADSILTALLNEIARIPEHFMLVLDDYHLIESQEIDRNLSFLLDHLPPQMHLVIATREDPQLPLARLRARGQLTELRVADLRFTPSEAALFLNQAMGLNLSEQDVAVLETRTEGWIAGLQMAALSMQRRTDAAGFIQTFTGSNRFVLDYLLEEVLQQQAKNVRTFLLQTAILDRLCGSLCDALLPDAKVSGQEILEYLEQANLFVIPLDDRRRWYRYHHLFADVLQARLTGEQADRLPVLHRRASKWYEQNDLPADAIRHALVAKDFERAADLIEIVWPAMDENFQSAAWLDWVKALPADLVAYRPVLCLGYAWSFLNSGEMEEGEAWLRKTERWLVSDTSANEETEISSHEQMVVADEAQFQSLPASIATARSYHAQSIGDLSGALKYARQALDLLPKDDHLGRGPAAALLGLTYWANGNLEEAYQAINSAMAGFEKAGYLVFAISGAYGLADIRIAQGYLQKAINTYEQSLQLVRAQGEPPLRGTADLYLGLGDLFRERGDLEKAERQVQKSEELGEQVALPDWPYRWRLAKARLREAQGDLNGAFRLLGEAERFYYRGPIPNSYPVAALKARLQIKQGKLREARAWARENGLSTENKLAYLREFEHITFARLLIAEYKNDPVNQSIQKTIAFLERLLKAAEEGRRTGSVIKILILQALAYEAQNEISTGIIFLERALSLAEPEAYIRTFADEGEAMTRLLSAVKARGNRQEYIHKILDACQTAERQNKQTIDPIAVSITQPLIEPLSQRELEILRLIAQGLSNREISERLFLALSTIKGHNQSIFGKLDVQRRTEAVARAQELGLL